MTEHPPAVLGGRYEVHEPIGHGGMADVYRGHDRVLQRAVAIKLLREVTEVDRDRFAAEALLLAWLSHESIVMLYDASVEEGRPWLALELVVGRSMSQVIREGPVLPGYLAAIGAQVAAGLAHAHDQGIVHRDIKPSNIMVTDGGRAQLTDFGIARLVWSEGHALTDSVLGTAAYISPEQLRGEGATGAADVYALGLLLLEALTGRRSFPGPATEAALARLRHGPLVPTSLAPGWPGLITAMTTTDPLKRPSAQLVAARLRHLEIVHGVPTTARDRPVQ